MDQKNRLADSSVTCRKTFRLTLKRTEIQEKQERMLIWKTRVVQMTEAFGRVCLPLSG